MPDPPGRPCGRVLASAGRGQASGARPGPPRVPVRMPRRGSGASLTPRCPSWPPAAAQGLLAILPALDAPTPDTEFPARPVPWDVSTRPPPGSGSLPDPAWSPGQAELVALRARLTRSGLGARGPDSLCPLQARRAEGPSQRGRGSCRRETPHPARPGPTAGPSPGNAATASGPGAESGRWCVNRALPSPGYPDASASSGPAPRPTKAPPTLSGLTRIRHMKANTRGKATTRPAGWRGRDVRNPRLRCAPSPSPLGAAVARRQVPQPPR